MASLARILGDVESHHFSSHPFKGEQRCYSSRSNGIKKSGLHILGRKLGVASRFLVILGMQSLQTV
jgi:hypothetical protein